MGESFLGHPNRFRIINNLLESTYNPNHMLSAYMGYRISNEYLNRKGGTQYRMTGPLYTTDILTTHTTTDPGNAPSIGSLDCPYHRVYAKYFHGITDIAKKLEHKVNLRIKGAVTGTSTIDGSEANVDIETKITHNHDSSYLKLTGGSVIGDICLNGVNSSILNQNNESVLQYQSDGEQLHIGKGTFISGHGSLNLYSYESANIHLGNGKIKLYNNHSLKNETDSENTVYIQLTGDGLCVNTNEKKGFCIGKDGQLYYRILNDDTHTYNMYEIFHEKNDKFLEIIHELKEEIKDLKLSVSMLKHQ